jgi:hypothetical protein
MVVSFPLLSMHATCSDYAILTDLRIPTITAEQLSLASATVPGGGGTNFEKGKTVAVTGRVRRRGSHTFCTDGGEFAAALDVIRRPAFYSSSGGAHSVRPNRRAGLLCTGQIRLLCVHSQTP